MAAVDSSWPLRRRIYLVPPSAWGLFAGALAGLAFNILMVVRFDGQHGSGSDQVLWLLFGLFMVSACAFGWLSTLLEEYRRSGDLTKFRMTVEAPREGKRLLVTLLSGTVSLLAALLVLVFS